LALLAFLAMALALPTTGMTLATIIAAITNATVRTKNMRLTI
jgi:F0F1-type ATP synthase membrane subunit c/vacuolar-type H+-ATPase subunit K